ncbi:MAG: transcription termination/antitermination protein NusA [Polyangiaceae bacterium]|nr:transcription termination/antitermination protein NusA [Polyangiaceae bacterium]MBK8997202.1 transcription termination/antitermination protein NusA [Myxococcales bacterium]MCE7892038.1 transcription termination/antitermination protein NusA [Sorangiineae bacterium PRO1]MCL4749376.1 transcription termination/antitermination protein NusA [Myxococcales bacterium]
MKMAAHSAGFGDDLGGIVEQVAQEKGIDKQILIETMEAAILKAAQAAFGPTRELEARFNEDSGHIDLFQYMTVVEEVADPEREIAIDVAKKHGLEAEIGEELGFQVFWHPRDAEKARQQDKEFGAVLDMKQARSTFGRIAAQTAKQVLLQRVRDAERDIIYNEYKDRQGQLIRGIVRRFEKGHNIVVDLGRTEGILPAREQTPRETYRPGDRIVAFVKDIDREARGPMIILSRSAPPLVDKLFEAEVPEIYEGIVKIVGVAREPGSRSKIAVTTRDSDVDPVGACVGIKGSRVQAVVQELRGEKIDIVPFDKDPARYIINAIQPAEVNKVIVDEADHRMELVVPDEKLSLAIGRKGQNVRLASQLTGWKLDIISESKFKQMEEEALQALRQIDGVDEDLARAMYRLGFRALEEIAEADVAELVSIQGVGTPEAAQSLKERAESSMERMRRERIEQTASRPEPLTEKEKLRFVRGVGLRTAQLVEEAGYKTVAELAREDADRLAIRTGLGIKKARLIQQGAQFFLDHEAKEIDLARAKFAAEAQAAPAPAPAALEE